MELSSGRCRLGNVENTSLLETKNRELKIFEPIVERLEIDESIGFSVRDRVDFYSSDSKADVSHHTSLAVF